jgi:hypothetical protein
MRLPRVLLAASTSLAALVVLAPAAHAQATRTWVSGVGDDANPCSRTAPCKTFAGAIPKTASGGTINVLDPGGYGVVTITKPITIDAGGQIASVQATSGLNGIIVNAPADAQVVLRGLDVRGTNTAEGTCGGGAGIRVLGAASVRLDDVTISGFNRAFEAPLTNSNTDVFVDLSLNDLRVNDNCEYGVRLAPDAGHHGRLTLDRSTITGSNTALSVAAGGEAWVSSSRIYLNNTGVQGAGGAIHSLCDNQVAGNATDGAFTDDARCGNPAPVVPTPTPVPTPTTPAPSTARVFCTVPKLTGTTKSAAATLLTSAGCTLGKTGKQASPASRKKQVVAQSIPAGTDVRAGTAVQISLGTGRSRR